MTGANSYTTAKAQLEWAPALANAAAVLALAGVVGNVPHPDKALSALTPSLGLFGLGMLLGAVALHVSLAVARSFNSMSAKAEQNLEIMEDLHAGLEADSVGTAATKARLAARIPEAQRLLDGMRGEMASIVRLQDWPGRLNIASLACCGLGFAFLLVGHAAGWIRLERF
jgi:hypothetical protein